MMYRPRSQNVSERTYFYLHVYRRRIMAKNKVTLVSQNPKNIAQQIWQMEKGMELWVTGQCWEGITEFADKVPAKPRSKKLTFTKRCLVSIESPEKNCKTVKHLYHAAEWFENKTPIDVFMKTELATTVSLRFAELPTISIPGYMTFNRVILYEGQAIVALDSNHEKSTGWIIAEDTIPLYLAALPSLQESGEWYSIWVSCLGQFGSEAGFAVEVTKVAPPITPPADPITAETFMNLYRIDYDSSTLLIKHIHNLTYDVSVSQMVCSESGRTANRGQWLPRVLRNFV